MRIFLLFAGVWILPLTSAFWYQSPYSVGLSLISQYYIFGLVMIVFILSALLSVIYRKKPPINFIRTRFSEDKAMRFHANCIKLWFCIFIIEFIASGGAPIMWDSSRGYGDFGLPTLHGFSNMLRAMIFAHFVLFRFLNFQMSKRITVLSILPLLMALFVEQSRGAFIMTIFFGLSPMLLFMRLSLGKILKTVVLIPILVMTLSAFQFLRYADSPTDELLAIVDFVSDYDSATQKLLMPVFNYIATPALNAGLTIDTSPLVNFTPNYSFQGLVPSPLRPLIWSMEAGEKDYGELVDEAFNTSTFITPFVKDFGVLGSGLFFFFFFFLCIYTYNKAKCGSIIHIIRLPPLVMCVGLSFFTSYVTSLVTILYLIASGPVARRMMHSRSVSYHSTLNVELAKL
ncbi:oligosaccharide repeat unit polymerase [Gammaproteobacteria bacterium]|nr:oligosaccharide repeat unit polymerase [Gammaproteobacteria bacterium]MDB4242861.1 oligosaccharide repeat unit polymerase [Gammaproteobacteria bacterium]